MNHCFLFPQQVRIGARADTDKIEGNRLWELTVFGNTEGDGSGVNRYDERKGFLSDDKRDQSFEPGGSLTFKQEVQFDLSGLACGMNGPFLCVEVTKAAGASVDFTLEEKWLGCL